MDNPLIIVTAITITSIATLTFIFGYKKVEKYIGSRILLIPLTVVFILLSLKSIIFYMIGLRDYINIKFVFYEDDKIKEKITEAEIKLQDLIVEEEELLSLIENYYPGCEYSDHEMKELNFKIKQLVDEKKAKVSKIAEEIKFTTWNESVEDSSVYITLEHKDN